MPGRRLFIAVPFPEDAAAAVRSILDGVRAEPLPAGARDVRWVRLDGLHLTLRFLGPTPDDRLGRAAAAVQAVAERATGPIPIELGVRGRSRRRAGPRALWLGIADGAEALGDLAAKLNAELSGAAGCPISAHSVPT